MLRAAPFALAGALVAAQAAVVVLRPRSGVIEPAPVDLGRFFSGAQLERATDFRSGQLALYGASLAVEAGALAFLVLRARRRGAAEPARHPLLRGAAAGAGISVAVAVVALPLSAWMRSRAIDVGLVTRSWGGWAWDSARSIAIGAGFAGLATAAALALMRRWARAWWLPASGLVVAVAALVIFAGPLVLDPLFNRFERLPDGPVRSEVLRLAERAGVDVGEVYVVDASKRTTAANAYVTGLGSSKRVVLYDTLLEDFPAAETRLVVAHELAHVRYRDVPRALLFVALVAPLGLFAVARLTRAWAPAGDRPPTARSVPALIAAFTLVMLLIGSVANQLSRRIEARADSYALELTGEAGAFLAQQRRLALRNVADPDPPRTARLVLGTHPTTRQRLGIGLAYEAGERP
jgi:STE24 endopeptidase